MPDIIGIGDSNVDLMIRVPHIPQHDEKVRGALFGKYAGGVIGNFCSASAMLGARTGIVSKIGNDEYGNICMADYERRGVDTSGVVKDPEVDTYFCVIHLDGTGEKALTIVETNGFLPHKGEVDLDFVRQAKYVHMTTLDVELAEYVFAALDGCGCVRSLDIEPTASKVERGVWERLLRRVDIAFPNEAGLLALTGKAGVEEGATELLSLGVKMVVATCGANGVHIFRDGYRHHQAVFPVGVKDSTGAGDCFNAAFLTMLLKGEDVEAAAKFASAAAGIAIGSIGAREGLPSYEAVVEFLKERGEAV